MISTNHFDPSYPLYPIMAALSIILVSLPAYWQFRARNIGTSLYITWTVIGNLVYMVNSIVWYGNLEEHSTFWCDLTTKLMIGWSAGLPAASLLINRRLYKIATINQVSIAANKGRKEVLIELAIGLGLPLLVMVLHVVAQGHRYDVIENIGCWPSIYITPVAIICVFIWPILTCMVSAVYCILSIRAFLKQRKAFMDILASSNSGLNVNRYFRLMALACTELVFGLPFSIYILASDLSHGINPYINWANDHFDFNRMEYMPFGIFAVYPSAWVMVNVTRYALPIGGYVFFAYLGLSGESGLFWERRWNGVKRVCGIKSKTAEVGQQASWIARPGMSNPSASHQLHSVPQLATFQSAYSSNGSSKKRDSLDLESLDDFGGASHKVHDDLTYIPDHMPHVDPPSPITQSPASSSSSASDSDDERPRDHHPRDNIV